MVTTDIKHSTWKPWIYKEGKLSKLSQLAWSCISFCFELLLLILLI